ncbi:MAG TPA: glycosyltransferase [Usitatibacter sp.]|nr:glycosyltransferase [Usitatibacter sp.]
MNSTASPPLVSIVVRTMGRPTLSRALASVAAQTHRPTEVVLVDAAGIGVDRKAHGQLTLRVVGGGPYDRPRAANAGLAAARGAWIMFLDEDDEIAPDHVALLLATAAVAGLPVAYSQTKLMAASDLQRLMGGGPFSREKLLKSNYMAINAVLFHRSLVDAGARFDESLEIFEDWDFWLQLSQKTSFAFTGQATAIYHAAAGASGAGSGGNLDREAVLAQRERLMGKWLQK